jgi:putative hydrolase of the HAD superfamily
VRRVPLLLLDLDNTLLDRESAFHAFASALLTDIGAPEADVDWLVATDNDGFASRYEVADALRLRYGLSATVVEIVEVLREGILAHTKLDPLVACAVQIAGNAGWVPVIVTNGTTRQQEAKIRMTGLDRYVAEWVISEEAGVRKPDSRIFEIAADRARMGLRGAWMIGDSPEADIAGAAGVGIPSVWLHRGRHWTETRFSPTASAGTPIAAVAAVLDHASAHSGAGPLNARQR